MTRFIMPAILIGISVAVFFTFTDPLYTEVSELRARVVSYNEALDNSRALENERDKLTQKYNAISAENLEKITKLLPDNVDNIRLILEIEKIASPYGMALKDVRYSTLDDKKVDPITGVAQTSKVETHGDYGVWDLEFSTTAPYSNFISFIKALESNLRIVDISSIDFSSTVETSSSASSSTSTSKGYPYKFKIKTYWLKN